MQKQLELHLLLSLHTHTLLLTCLGDTKLVVVVYTVATLDSSKSISVTHLWFLSHAASGWQTSAKIEWICTCIRSSKLDALVLTWRSRERGLMNAERLRLSFATANRTSVSSGLFGAAWILMISTSSDSDDLRMLLIVCLKVSRWNVTNFLGDSPLKRMLTLFSSISVVMRPTVISTSPVSCKLPIGYADVELVVPIIQIRLS